MSKEPVSIRKMTPATVLEVGRGGKLPKPSKLTALYVVYGVAEQAVVKPTAFDDVQKVIYGKFEAIRPDLAIGDNFKRESAKYTSDTLYLPEPYHTRIVGGLEPNKDTGEVRAVEFALKVSYKPNSDSPTGYEFVVEPVMPDANQDKMAAVRARVDGVIAKALPAPGK